LLNVGILTAPQINDAPEPPVAEVPTGQTKVISAIAGDVTISEQIVPAPLPAVAIDPAGQSYVVAG